MLVCRRMRLSLALVLLVVVHHVKLECSNGCAECREVTTGSHTGKFILIVNGGKSGCLYRRQSDGAFMRFCDPPNLSGDMYTICSLAGATECVEPPLPAHYGFDEYTYKGDKTLEAYITYTCISPKNITGVEGNVLTIFCATLTFPQWQIGQSGSNTLPEFPRCEYPGVPNT